MISTQVGSDAVSEWAADIRKGVETLAVRVFLLTALLQAIGAPSATAQTVDHYKAEGRAKAVVVSHLDPTLPAVSLEQ